MISSFEKSCTVSDLCSVCATDGMLELTLRCRTGQVSHLKVLEKENSKLLRRLETFEKQHENVDVMKETIKSLEKQVKVMDSLRDQLAASQAQVDQLKREQREWCVRLALAQSRLLTLHEQGRLLGPHRRGSGLYTSEADKDARCDAYRECEFPTSP